MSRCNAGTDTEEEASTLTSASFTSTTKEEEFLNIPVTFLLGFLPLFIIIFKSITILFLESE